MIRQDIAEGESVWVRLDGKFKSKGTVTECLDELCFVKLSEPCKEHKKGDIIRVGYDELYCVFKHQN